MANELKAKTKAAWKLKALKAGIGIIAPAPKAAIKERSLQRTWTPHRFKTSPTLSWKKNNSLDKYLKM